jgi:hypothetical protein
MGKKTMKSGFKVCNIWPLNLASMVRKFGPNEMFTIIEEEGIKKCMPMRCNRRF